jgi:glycosyltransferase involved in cell wall biosynthesis
MAKKMAFMMLMQHPAYDSIIEEIKKHFPEYETELIDVRSLAKKKKMIRWVNLFFVLKIYGLEILRGKKKIRGCIYRTPYMFRKVKDILSERLSQDEYAFSFQFQNLFDGSTEGLPHYLFTDHTHLAQRQWHDFGKKPFYGAYGLYSSKWIELEKTIYHNATINFTQSSNITDSIIKDYSCPPEKVISVYGGSSVGTDFKIDKEKYKNKEILFVAYNWEEKGGPQLAQAFKLVLQAHPDARLTIVGCSPELDIPNCDIVGQVPNENINQYYERASVFCLPTKLEPVSLVFLEAYAHGLPVVTTDFGITSGFIEKGETGYCVKYGDVTHLANVLTDLIGNPEKCQTMGANGRRLVIEKYSWEKAGTIVAKAILATMNNK